MERLNLSRQRSGELVVTPGADGWLQVWERPLIGCYYLLSVRPGGMPKVIGGRRDRERSVVMVLRRGYVEAGSELWHVARLVARIAPPVTFDPTPLAELAAMVAGWYGNALSFVEVKDGATTAKECQKLGMNVQVREVLDKATGAFTENLGWDSEENDGEAGSAAVNALVNAIRETGARANVDVETRQAGDREKRWPLALQVECEHCLTELDTFPWVASDAPPVSHDDDVRALATGVYNLDSASKLVERRRAPMKPPDGWKVVESFRG